MYYAIVLYKTNKSEIRWGGEKDPSWGAACRVAVEGIYLWLTTATHRLYISTAETTIPIEPSDALGSTPLTIRNIAMGNLLPIAKSISRRIRHDGTRGVVAAAAAASASAVPNEQFGRPRPVMDSSYLLHIWRSCTRRRVASVANPVSRDRERPRRRWAIAAIFIIDRRRSDTSFLRRWRLSCTFFLWQSIERDKLKGNANWHLPKNPLLVYFSWFKMTSFSDLLLLITVI